VINIFSYSGGKIQKCFLKALRSAFILLLPYSCSQEFKMDGELPLPEYNLKYDALAKSWDEAIPLGNGMVGELVWEKDGKLRFSLDRADLWDLRPMENLNKPEWKYSWVRKQWEDNNYKSVQELFDVPYDANPAPSKIPGGALEFDISALGETESVELQLKDALCRIKWKNGASLQTFVHAGSPVGWFRFEGVENELIPGLIAPAYNLEGQSGPENSLTGQDLRRLGYPKGEVLRDGNSVTYNQEGWGGFRYQINVRWEKKGNVTEGCWSISSEYPGWEKQTRAVDQTSSAISKGFSKMFEAHQSWWRNFWLQSDISLPDSVLCRQWHLEMYKLGAATGNGAPPISLQAVWTADAGKLPPWKGDFHHDLNTQLSYWPTYSSNHMDQEKGFIDWLQKNRPEFEKYTRSYFGTAGLNVPGVTTLTGQPMGGWIQYSFGPTVSSWLGHHLYLHWRYTMDREFLEKEAWPWIRDVAVYLDQLSVKDSSGMRKLPVSSSPEIFDNSRKAWFSSMTNFDLGLVRFTFEKAAELAAELGKTGEAKKWSSILAQWPDYDIDSLSGFTYAKGVPYSESHRHFSHLIAFHPLGLVDKSKGERDRQIIDSTIKTLDKIGPDWWCGYSWSWLGNIKARAFDGEGAAEALRIFAQDFCLPNSFHVNGDQSGTGKSKMTYRPFTLEGNFAFASGVQEMLIQSHTGIIRIFPAIPENWKDLSFNKLRTEGAFLVTATMKKGETESIIVFSEKGGELKLFNPFSQNKFKCSSVYKTEGDIISIQTIPGQKIIFGR
jgi:alpha-L-fucosidase 2